MPAEWDGSAGRLALPFDKELLSMQGGANPLGEPIVTHNHHLTSANRPTRPSLWILLT
jgi:hypothetical protein